MGRIGRKRKNHFPSESVHLTMLIEVKRMLKLLETFVKLFPLADVIRWFKILMHPQVTKILKLTLGGSGSSDASKIKLFMNFFQKFKTPKLSLVLDFEIIFECSKFQITTFK